MKDLVYIGPTPAEEDCAQIEAEDYSKRARPECQRFMDLIRVKLGPEPTGARLKILSQPHDFGSYLEVVCEYDGENEAAADYAFKCEGEAPATWEG